MEEDSTVSQDTITRLQSVLLTSVVEELPLPGQTEPVRFPDLAFITQASKVLVSDDAVSGQLDVSSIEKPVEITPLAAIREEASQSGDHFYVQFRPTKEQEGQITIVIEVRMAPAEADLKPLGLGGIQATFVQQPNGRWEVIDPPVLYGI